MLSLVDLLTSYVFAGIPSNAVYDLLKTVWQKMHARSWEDLYLDALQTALGEELPYLGKLADDQVGLLRQDLRNALSYEIIPPFTSFSLSELADPAFVQRIAQALVRSQILIIPGHQLTEGDYARVVVRLVQRAAQAFKASIEMDPAALQRAILLEAGNNRALAAQTLSYLIDQYRLLFQALDEHTDLLRSINEKTDRMAGVVDRLAWSPTALQRGDELFINLPSREALLLHVAAVQAKYQCWADQPQPIEQLLQQNGCPGQERGLYLRLHAQPLPIRVTEFHHRSEQAETPSRELLGALARIQRAVILGEPGSGKTTVLERLAWTIATECVTQLKGTDRLIVPLVARLADYRGEPDLVSLLRRSLNSSGVLTVDDLSVRHLLWSRDVTFVLLLDGLNEFGQQFRDEGPSAIARHLADYPRHPVYLTCRTADFDQANVILPDAEVWEIQPLVDDIRYWDDDSGISDIRDYLRHHLGDTIGKRLYQRLRADERVYGLTRLPLFLWMCKEVGGAGDLPNDRGEMLRSFVRSERLLSRVPLHLRREAERSLVAVGWSLQSSGNLEIGDDCLYDALAAARGRHSYELDRMRTYLQNTGLLVSLGDGRWRMLHQLIQEYAAATELAAARDCDVQLSELGRDQWWRETCILALQLRPDLHSAQILLALMGDPKIDVCVRIAAADTLSDVGDPRFAACEDPETGTRYIEPQMVLIPGGDASLGGPDQDAWPNELPECSTFVGAFELAVFPVTNLEYSCFISAGCYTDETLWTAAGRAWLRGEGQLDAETEGYYRALHSALQQDTDGVLADWKATQLFPELSDEDADNWREMARWPVDRFIKQFTKERLGESRREPAWWADSHLNRPTQPVVGVNWHEAMAYAAWLRRVTQRPYRLPSEAEWDWAARRGRRRFAWGDAWDPSRCNSAESYLRRPSPVGIYPHGATDDGLLDLTGSVEEWTASLYRPYPYLSGDGREQHEAAGVRSVRGGSWCFGRARVRCSSRDKFGPDVRGWYADLGFRLARAIA